MALPIDAKSLPLKWTGLEYNGFAEKLILHKVVCDVIIVDRDGRSSIYAVLMLLYNKEENESLEQTRRARNFVFLTNI